MSLLKSIKLQPVTKNTKWKILNIIIKFMRTKKYALKDYFEVTAKINSISFYDTSDEYTFLFFDVELQTSI